MRGLLAGELDERIELFAPGEAEDDGYQTLPGGWETQGERWARYMPGTVREVFENLGREGELPAVFRVRRDGVTETVTDTWKLLHRGKTYDVVGATREGRDGIRITAIGSDEAVPTS